jgi:lipopolysaccharide/colanic/teichoic acid biosynthesis glycosyltransferase
MVSALFKQVRRFKKRRTPSKNCHPIPVTAPVAPTNYFRFKFVLDYLLATLLLLPGLPIMLFFICLVRITSRGAAIYSQCRVGRKGETFWMYKIRSMTDNAETLTGPAWTQAADPRVTWVGRFMRKFHVDELPQLFNVLQGHMSLVGPRPERPEFVEVLSRRIPEYKNRLAVLPGITGLAQLNLPPDSDLESVRRKVVLDIEYIRTASFWLDMRLMLCTAMRLIKLPIFSRIFGIYREPSTFPNGLETISASVSDGVVTLAHVLKQAEPESRNGNVAKYHRCRKSMQSQSTPK